MISLFNAFVLLLLGGAALLGVSALVQKRTVRRHKDAPQATDAGNHAA